MEISSSPFTLCFFATVGDRLEGQFGKFSCGDQETDSSGTWRLRKFVLGLALTLGDIKRGLT